MVGGLGVGDESLEGLDRDVGRLHALRGVDQEDLVGALGRDPVELGRRGVVVAEQLRRDVAGLERVAVVRGRARSIGLHVGYEHCSQANGPRCVTARSTSASI